VTNAQLVVVAFFIPAEDSVALALGALAVLQLVPEAGRADFMMKAFVQVTVYYFTHIDFALFHQLIMLVLHVDHNVPGLVRQRGASDALHSFLQYRLPVSCLLLLHWDTSSPHLAQIIGTLPGHRQAQADFP